VSELANLLVGGLSAGAIYGLFGACLAVWFGTSNILNLAIGDFAMLGTLVTAQLAGSAGLPVGVAVLGALVVAGVVAWIFDRVVLHLAVDGSRPHSGLVTAFFYTIALSFLLEGLAERLYGTNVYTPPSIWAGPPLRAGSVYVTHGDILTFAVAVIGGVVLAAYLRLTVSGKAATACGQTVIGSRVVGINASQLRRRIFVCTAVLAALFGVVASSDIGFAYNTGAAISLVGIVAAGFAGFRHPGRAVVFGLAIGVVESLLGGYVSSGDNDVILYGILVLVLVLTPEVLGLGAAAL
jgi:branched-chain amino acid transport system permease protein